MHYRRDRSIDLIVNECVLDVASQYGGAAPGVVTTYDKSRFHNDGTLTNVTWTQIGGGLWVTVFDGVDDNINCGSDASLDALTGSITLKAWIKPNTLGENNSGRIFDKTLGNTGFSLFVGTPGAERGVLLLYIGGVVKYAQAGITLGVWTHIMAVHDGSNGIIYLNTIRTLGDATGGAITDHSANDLLIGDRLGSNACFDGGIALPQAWNYAWNPAQIRANFHSEKWLFGVPL